jgi:hypothetical protein
MGYPRANSRVAAMIPYQKSKLDYKVMTILIRALAGPSKKFDINVLA